MAHVKKAISQNWGRSDLVIQDRLPCRMRYRHERKNQEKKSLSFSAIQIITKHLGERGDSPSMHLLVLIDISEVAWLL